MLLAIMMMVMVSLTFLCSSRVIVSGLARMHRISLSERTVRVGSFLLFYTCFRKKLSVTGLNHKVLFKIR